jgi:hypothetical protein
MRRLALASILLAVGLAAAPDLARAQAGAPMPGSQAIPGEGPGGSGAGESPRGLGRDGPWTHRHWHWRWHRRGW